MLTALMLLSLAAGDDTQHVMRGNLTAVFVLQRYLASPIEFRDPSNAGVINDSLALLARQQHPFMTSGDGPTQAALSLLFAQQVDRAREDFTRGSPDSARLRLRSVTGMCLGCHSRAPTHDLPGIHVANDANLPPAEFAQYLAATRQFDAALRTWKTVLEAPPKNGRDAYDQAIALRAAVSISVRVKDDPALTLELLERVKGRTELPGLVQRAAAEWVIQATAWKAEKLVAAEQSPGALFARAKQLVESSQAAASVVPDEAHLVALQRAVSYLNQALAREPKAKWRGEALYLLALSTSVVMDPDLWQLDGMFLEACVMENPHTRLAVRCVDRLADRTVYQYTLSGDTRVPMDIGSRLGDLRAIAR
ncbi:MAG: hypothetical protein IPJ65_04395 [Archangiaceae bacterium]|nr:hypothetical protein [Archangiaceae bacterium]